MSLNESIVEDAALEWSLLHRGCGGQVVWLGHGVGHGASYATLRRAKPQLTPCEPASRDGGRDSFGEGVQSRISRTLIPAFSLWEKEWCEATRRLNPAIPSRILATLRDPEGAGLLKLLSGELSVANAREIDRNLDRPTA